MATKTRIILFFFFFSSPSDFTTPIETKNNNYLVTIDVLRKLRAVDSINNALYYFL